MGDCLGFSTRGPFSSPGALPVLRVFCYSRWETCEVQDVCLPFALEGQGLVDVFSSLHLLLSRDTLALSRVTFVSCRVTVLLCPGLLLLLALAAALVLAHSSIPRPPPFLVPQEETGGLERPGSAEILSLAAPWPNPLSVAVPPYIQEPLPQVSPVRPGPFSHRPDVLAAQSRLERPCSFRCPAGSQWCCSESSCQSPLAGECQGHTRDTCGSLPSQVLGTQ